MRTRRHQLINNHLKVKVVAQAEDNTANRTKTILLATAVAGVFYFFGSNLWQTLVGG